MPQNIKILPFVYEVGVQLIAIMQHEIPKD
jgi:hypothetical protein